MQKKRPKSTTFFTKKHCFDAVLAPFSEHLSPQRMANTLRNKQLKIHGDSDRCFKKIFFRIGQVTGHCPYTNKSSRTTSACTLPEYILRSKPLDVTKTSWTDLRVLVSSMKVASLWRSVWS